MSLDVTNYIEMYKQQWGELMATYADSASPLVDYGNHSVATTWMMSFKAIKSKSEIAANLLLIWAFLDNSNLSYDLFHGTSSYVLEQGLADPKREQWPLWLHEISCNKAKFYSAAGLLMSYSMIEARDQMKGSFSVHPVVHRWASFIQDEATRRTHILLATILIGTREILPLERGTRDQYLAHPRLFAHAQQCWLQFLKEPQLLASPEWRGREVLLVQALKPLGFLFVNQGELIDAERVFTVAVEASNQCKGLGPNHRTTLTLESHLANVYSGLGRLDEADAHYDSIFDANAKAENPDFTMQFSLLNLKASMFKKQKRRDGEAEKILIQLYRMCDICLGPNAPNTIKAAMNLGIFYRDCARYQEADDIFSRLLEQCPLTLDQDNLLVFFTTADHSFQLLVKLKSLDPEEILDLLYLILECKELLLGGNHPSTLESLEDLAWFYYKRNLYGKAIPLARRALKGRQQLQGSSSEDTHKMVVLLFSLKLLFSLQDQQLSL
jgi:tetratricopeptide (TPR) repeat protein